MGENARGGKRDCGINQLLKSVRNKIVIGEKADQIHYIQPLFVKNGCINGNKEATFSNAIFYKFIAEYWCARDAQDRYA